MLCLFIHFNFLLHGLEVPDGLPSACDVAEWENPLQIPVQESIAKWIPFHLPSYSGYVSDHVQLSRDSLPDSQCEGPCSSMGRQAAEPVSKADLVCILRILWGFARASCPEHVQWLLFQMKELVCLCFNYLFLQDLPSSIAPHSLKEFN